MFSTVEVLRKGVKENALFNAICHVFAMRKRTRPIIRISSLMNTMSKEGFTFTRKDYEDALKILQEAKIGDAVTNSKGNVIYIKNIRYTLQSIGMAACGTDKNLIDFRKQHRFQHLQFTPVSVLNAEVKDNEIKSTVGLTVYLEGKPITMELSKDIKTDEIARLITKLRAV